MISDDLYIFYFVLPEHIQFSDNEYNCYIVLNLCLFGTFLYHWDYMNVPFCLFDWCLFRGFCFSVIVN